MNRLAISALGILVVSWAVLSSQAAGSDCLPQTIFVEGKGPARLAAKFEFEENTSPFPGLQRGVLSIGNEISLTTTILVPEQRTRTETYRVIRVVDGRIVVETRTREVTYTVYRPVLETRTVELPDLRGKWQSVDFCTFSAWNLLYLGPEGLVTGAGITLGESLKGTIVILGVRGIPSGVYQLTSTTEMPPVCE